MRRIRHASQIAALPLAAIACSGGTTSPAAETQPVTSLRDIEGEWDIARFDGYAPTRLHDGIRRAFVDVRGDGLSYVIECNYSGNRARIDRAGVLHDTGGGSRVQTLMGCGPVRQARDEAFFRFFAARPRVTRVAEERLRLFDGRRELLLERPALRRLANVPPLGELVGRWTPQGATQTVAGGGYQGWGFQSAYPLTIAAGRVTWPGCGGVSYQLRYTAEGRMLVADGAVKSCGADDPGSALVRILAAGPLAERDASGGIALTANGETLTLSARNARPRRGTSG